MIILVMLVCFVGEFYFIFRFISGPFQITTYSSAMCAVFLALFFAAAINAQVEEKAVTISHEEALGNKKYCILWNLKIIKIDI